jgi:hypothetical protein
MFAARDRATGRTDLYLLVQPGGAAFTGEALEALIAVGGEPVETSGVVSRRDNQLLLEFVPADVRRR